MDRDFIQVSKKAASNDYFIRIYFAEIDSEVNISLTEADFVKFLNESVKVINQHSDKFTLRVPDDIYYLADEYGVNQIYRIKDKMQRTKKKKQEADVFIFIPDEYVDISTAENLTNSTGEFMEALGFN